MKVVLKIVDATSEEVAIATFLSNEPGAEDHALRILEVIPMDDTVPEASILVMPCMRRSNLPPYFTTVREFTEFVHQVLEVSTTGSFAQLILYLISTRASYSYIAGTLLIGPS